MKLPSSIDMHWIATLSDPELEQAEWELRASFAKQEAAEKKRSGAKYNVMRWPAVLTNAWLRWSLVSNETRARGLRIHYKR